MFNQTKIDAVRATLKQYDAEIAFFYSSYNDQRYSRWLFNLSPVLYHYVYVTPDTYGLIEIDYLSANNVAHFAGDVFLVAEETEFRQTIEQHFKGYSKVALVGLAPYFHFADLNAEFIDLTKEFSLQMAQKTHADVQRLKPIAADFYRILDSIQYADLVEQTEADAAHFVRNKLLQFGENLAFPVSLVSGDRLKTHTAGLPTQRYIAQGDPIAIDCGIVVDGFNTDGTRMFFHPKDKRSDNYQKLSDCHQHLIAEIKAGMSLADIRDGYGRLFDATFADYQFFPDGLGHSIGYGLHEEPIFINGNENYVLQPHHIIALEPEILVDGLRYRIEDMIWIQETKAEMLSQILKPFVGTS